MPDGSEQVTKTLYRRNSKIYKKALSGSYQRDASVFGKSTEWKEDHSCSGTNGKGSVCAYLDAMLRAKEKAPDCLLHRIW